MLHVSGKLSLENNITKFDSGFSTDETLNNLICKYLEISELMNELKCFDIISKITYMMSGFSIDEYAEKNIFKPLRMRFTSFTSHTLTTTSNDYLKLCNNICNNGEYLSKNKELQKAINTLCEFINNSSKQYYSYIDRNCMYALIDVKKL